MNVYQDIVKFTIACVPNHTTWFFLSGFTGTKKILTKCEHNMQAQENMEYIFFSPNEKKKFVANTKKK